MFYTIHRQVARLSLSGLIILAVPKQVTLFSPKPLLAAGGICKHSEQCNAEVPTEISV